MTHCRPPGASSLKWFKFDDGEVSEAKLDDEEVGSSLVCNRTSVLCAMCCVGVQVTVFWRGIHWRGV